MDAPNVNPQTHYTPANESKLKWAKRAIVVMSTLICIGLVVLVAKLAGFGFAPVSANRTSQDAIRLLLPSGSTGKVQALALGNRGDVAISVDTPEGTAVYVIDVQSGKLLSQIQLMRQTAPMARNFVQ